MDRFWYHRLLYGAVNHGRYIEERARRILPELNLTDAIGKASPFEVFGKKVRSPGKIDIFYWSVAVALLILAVLSVFVGPQVTKPGAKLTVPQEAPSTVPSQQPPRPER